MKRAKKLWLLLGVLAIVCVATFIVIRTEAHKEQIRNSDEVILELPTDSVQSLSWEYESETLSFHKDEKWLYDDDAAFPVDEEKLNALLSQFESFGVSFVIEGVEDFAQYGLDDPICTIRLATADATYEILLGDYSKMDSERYVSIGDGNAYLVKNDPLEQFDAVLSDMIDNDETPTLDNVSCIEFTGAESYAVTYEEGSIDTYCVEDVYFVKRGEEKLPLDTGRVKSYLGSISSLNLTEYVSYNVTNEELQSYGLDAPELTISIAYTFEDKDEKECSDTFVLHVSRDPDELKAAEKSAADTNTNAAKESDEDTDEEVTAYVRVGESQIVYQISKDDYTALMAASCDDFRHREVLSADFADITQLDISLEGVNYTFASEVNSDDERVWYYGDEELEIDALQSALCGMSVENTESFTEEKPEGKQEISVTVHLDNENHPSVIIRLYRYNGSSCLAVVDGESVALIPRAQAVDLIEAINAVVLS